MRIRMLVDMPDGASRNGQPWPKRGEVTESIPTAEAAHLVASGVAEVVEDEPRRPKPSPKPGPKKEREVGADG
jgi:hypothetical protein